MQDLDSIANLFEPLIDNDWVFWLHASGVQVDLASQEYYASELQFETMFGSELFILSDAEEIYTRHHPATQEEDGEVIEAFDERLAYRFARMTDSHEALTGGGFDLNWGPLEQIDLLEQEYEIITNDGDVTVTRFAGFEFLYNIKLQNGVAERFRVIHQLIDQGGRFSVAKVMDSALPPGVTVARTLR